MNKKLYQKRQRVVELELTNLIGIGLGEVESIKFNRSLVRLFFHHEISSFHIHESIN